MFLNVVLHFIHLLLNHWIEHCEGVDNLIHEKVLNCLCLSHGRKANFGAYPHYLEAQHSSIHDGFTNFFHCLSLFVHLEPWVLNVYWFFLELQIEHGLLKRY